MVREWDAHQALSRTSKRRLAVFTLAIIAFTVVLAGPSPLVLAVVSVMAPACLIGIIRMPEIEGDFADAIASPERNQPGQPELRLPVRLNT